MSTDRVLGQEAIRVEALRVRKVVWVPVCQISCYDYRDSSWENIAIPQIDIVHGLPIMEGKWTVQTQSFFDNLQN
jgi:hypothetical protein